MTASPGHALVDRIRERARGHGFVALGVAAPEPAEHIDAYRAWIESGRHADMEYLARGDAMARRAEPGRYGDFEPRSLIVVAHPYGAADAAASRVALSAAPDSAGVPDDPSLGVIARYARGRDYHNVLRKRLGLLLREIEEEARAAGVVDPIEGRIEGRTFVDAGPVLERELARRAGLGWFGRNTMLIDPARGSYFLLGVLALDLELPLSEPFTADRCGSCSACLPACPTGALEGRDEAGAPILDARKCISYWTIETSDPIPVEIREAMGNRVFGCDICQEVCPWNRFADPAGDPAYAARGPGERPHGVEALPGEDTDSPGEGRSATPDVSAETHLDSLTDVSAEACLTSTHVSAETPLTPTDVSAETSGRRHAHPGTAAPPLIDLMRMTREDWEVYSRGSPIRRAGYEGLRRNVAVGLGNWLAGVDEPPAEAVEVLRGALEDESELVREHAAWALGRVGTRTDVYRPSTR